MLVRERIGDVGGRPAERDDVVSELAGHLEDSCEAMRAEGVGESEAMARALAEAADWLALASRIRNARRGPAAINDRTRQLWLPGLASLTAANLLLMGLAYRSLEPGPLSERSTAWFPGLALMAAYLPWLAAQPLVGALGAWLSERAGGGRAMRLCAGLFPSIVMLACWGIFIPASAALERNDWVLRHPFSIALGAIGWVAPAVTGLLLGALPFLRMPPAENGNGIAAQALRP